MDYKQVSDIELWQGCRQDDLQAYNELFSRFYSRMHHLVSRYVSDTMKAEELCMDQLFHMWVKHYRNGQFIYKLNRKYFGDILFDRLIVANINAAKRRIS